MAAQDDIYFLYYVVSSRTPLVDYIADRLHCLPNTTAVVQNLYNELGLSRGGGSRLTTLQKAKCVLEHLQRPADVIDAVMAALEAAAAKRLANAKAARAKREQEEGDMESGAEEDDLVVRDTERDEWISPPEDSDQDDDEGAGSVKPAVSAAAVPAADDGRNQRKAVEPGADSRSADGRPDGGSRAVGEAVAASLSAPSVVAPAGQREVLPMPRVVDIEGEPPEGCRIMLSPPTTTSSPCWVGRLPPRSAYMGQATISRSFKPDDVHSVSGKRSAISSAVARRTVLSWLWEWDALSDAEKQQERDAYFLLHPREALEDAGVSSRSAASQSGDAEGPQPKRHKKNS